jgi:hypothetical protein
MRAACLALLLALENVEAAPGPGREPRQKLGLRVLRRVGPERATAADGPAVKKVRLGG